MQLIQHVTVESGGIVAITFSGIPQTFTDLVVLLSGRSSRSAQADNGLIGFNGSTADFTNRSLVGYAGGGLENASVARLFGVVNGSTSASNTFSNTSIYIPNYRSSAAKSFFTDAIGEDNSTTAYLLIGANLWNNTNPITSIQLTLAFNSYVQNSVASLYGITAGNSGGVVVS